MEAALNMDPNAIPHVRTPKEDSILVSWYAPELYVKRCSFYLCWRAMLGSC